jgi:hypothetical protein
MSLHTKFLIELFQTLPEDAVVRGFAEGLAVTNADGSGELAMLDDHVVFEPRPRSPSCGHLCYCRRRRTGQGHLRLYAELGMIESCLCQRISSVRRTVAR